MARRKWEDTMYQTSDHAGQQCCQNEHTCRQNEDTVSANNVNLALQSRLTRPCRFQRPFFGVGVAGQPSTAQAALLCFASMWEG